MSLLTVPAVLIEWRAQYTGYIFFQLRQRPVKYSSHAKRFCRRDIFFQVVNIYAF